MSCFVHLYVAMDHDLRVSILLLFVLIVIPPTSLLGDEMSDIGEVTDRVYVI